MEGQHYILYLPPYTECLTQLASDSYQSLASFTDDLPFEVSQVPGVILFKYKNSWVDACN